MPELPYLSLVVWTPILGGIWVLLASGARIYIGAIPASMLTWGFEAEAEREEQGRVEEERANNERETKSRRLSGALSSR